MSGRDELARQRRSKLIAELIGGAVLGAIISLLVVVWLLSERRGSIGLVVYCAHDAVYSEPLLREFESRTGIALDIRFDTEATKSLGLVELIRRERDNPRC